MNETWVVDCNMLTTIIGEQGTCFTIRWAEIAQGEIILSALQKKKYVSLK